MDPFVVHGGPARRLARLHSHRMNQRVLSGMRPTGALHLGHYHGALKNCMKLQHEFDCFYFVADLGGAASIISTAAVKPCCPSLRPC